MAERAFINPPAVKRAGVYSHVVSARGGTTIYISGQVAIDKDGNVVGRGDLRAQTRQVMENLKHCLAAAGATFADVVKINTYVVDLKPEMRLPITEVRNQYLNVDNPPASTLVGVPGLVGEGLLIEIEAIAVIN